MLPAIRRVTERACQVFDPDIPFTFTSNVTEVIQFQPIRWPPYNTYEEINKTDGHITYKMCGPLVQLMTEMAVKMNLG